MRTLQRRRPCASGSSAWTTPDFWPRTSARLPPGRLTEHRRLPEVGVEAGVLRAVRLIVAAARHVPRVARGDLAHPFDGAGRDVERHDGVRRRRSRVRVRVARRNVDGTCRGIDRGNRPHGGAGRAELLRACGTLRGRLRLFRNRIRVPDLFAGRRVERDHASAERAARIRRRPGGSLLTGRHGHVEPTVVERRRAADARAR